MSNPHHDEKGKFASGDSSQQAATSRHAAVRIDSANSPRVKTGYQGSAKAETIAKFQRVDERSYPTRSAADVAELTGYAGAHTGTKGVGPFGNSPPKLDPTKNDHLNAILQAAASPAPRTQPSTGQMVAAGLTGSTKG
jgi:hypothetical protein